jgi:glycine oxidase
MSKRIVIIGGGIIGLLSAYFLNQEGQSVVLLDKGALGKESSWAGGGIISPLYPWRYPDEVSLLSAYGQQHYQALCETLHKETGINPEWVKSGLLMLGLDELSHAQQWAKQYANELHIIEDSRHLATIEAELHPEFKQALWMPNIAQIRNPRLLKALKRQLQQSQVEIQEHTPVSDIKLNQQGEMIGVITKNGIVEADKVIISSGAWSAQLPALQNIGLHVKPVSGEMILFNAAPQRLKRIILHQGRYLIPRQDGRILCGSTLAFTDFEKQTHAVTKQSLHETAYQLAPFLRTATIEHHWCGLRPASPNGVPYIGEHPYLANVYINTGHYRYGVTMGLASVKLLMDILMQRTSFLDIKRFSIQSTRLPSAEFHSN